uniref:Degenerin mec-10-like n=1 Tax=Crassostrea virginica TaxID=6565 RepID=A0A8B8EAJ0_CRAVI|nr:degenerin mec-10-like [Crassostrea virginica]
MLYFLRQHSSISSEKMYTSVSDVISSLVSESSLHGLPKILSSKRWYQRVLWICLVLVTFGFLVHQLYQLFCEYKRYPVKTKVSMKRATLPFPAVSFCNMNPMKKSQMKHIKGTELYNFVMNKFSFDASSNSIYGSEFDNNDYNLDPNDYQYKNDLYLDDYVPSSGSVNESLVKNVNTNAHDNDFAYFYSFSDYHDMFSDDVEESDLLNALEDFINFLSRQKALQDDPRSEEVKRFMVLFQNETKITRAHLGHSIEDLLINCSFNGKICSAKNFTLFQTLDFGNCYTLSSEMYETRRTGPRNGLQIILQLEIGEVGDFLEGSGVRLVIHPPGTLPFPAEEGFTLSSGYETSIGMKMVSLSRSKPPYGKCVDGGDFYRMYGVHYTVTTCINLCRNTKVLHFCNCRPSENIVDIEYMNQFADLPVCSLVEKTNSTTKQGCENYVYYQIEEGVIKCECESACNETVYKSTLSGRVWPRESFLKHELLGTACSYRNYSYCREKGRQLLQHSYFKDNFLKAVIYYEDLNFKEITEEPLYDGFRFLSDIGGALGLFLGASLLSFVEIVQLLVEILNYFRHKCFKDRTDVEKPTCIFVEPMEGSNV